MSKIELKNLITEHIDKKNAKKNSINRNFDNKYYIYKLEDENSKLLDKEVWSLIKKFFELLSEDQNVVANLLINADYDELRFILAPFFCHNFCQNILSPYTVDEKYLLTISIMLNREIKELKSINDIDNFLNDEIIDEHCGMVLSELRNKLDIKNFSKYIINDVLEEIEKNCSDKEINLNLDSLSKDLEKMISEYKIKNVQDLEDIIFLNNKNASNEDNEKKENVDSKDLERQQKSKYFNDNYIIPLTKGELETKLNKEYGNDIVMKQYIQKKLDKIQNTYNSKDSNIFSSDKLIEVIYSQKDDKLLLSLYQNEFLKIINLLDLLIASLEKNINTIPYSIRCICLMIKMRLKLKFPNINETEGYYFISKFLFSIILIPNFIDSVKLYINMIIFSNNGIKNLKFLFKIFKIFSLGRFFQTDEQDDFKYTPFNWYFLRNIKRLFVLYDEISTGDIPILLQKSIKGQLPKNYKYNYFKENPNDIFYYQTSSFTLEDINCLLNIMKKNETKLFEVNSIINENIIADDDDIEEEQSELKKIYNKLLEKRSNNKLKIQEEETGFEVLNIENVDVEIFVSLPVNNMFLINDLIINPKYEKLITFERKKDYFTTKQSNNIKNDYVIKAKNYFCGVLYGCRKLCRNDLLEANSTEDALEKIKCILKNKDYTIDKYISNELFVNYLLNFLAELPIELKKNDYKKLYKEIEDGLKNSINIIDFVLADDGFEKIRYISNSIELYKSSIKEIKSILRNQKVKYIFDNSNASLDLKFIYTENVKEMKLYVHKPDGGGKRVLCSTLPEFIKNFPNFAKKKEENPEFSIFYEMMNLKIPKVIKTYLDYISKKDNFKKKYAKDAKKIKYKLYDFVLTKLNDKLYPKIPSIEDNIVYSNCVKYSWLEPQHFFDDGRNFNYEAFLPDIKKIFTRIEKANSPKRKSLFMMNLIRAICAILKFCGCKEITPGEQLEILSFYFFKVQPKRINSDLEYVKIFENEKDKKEFNMNILLSAYKFIKNFSNKDVKNISPNEIDVRCNMANKKIKKVEQIIEKNDNFEESDEEEDEYNIKIDKNNLSDDD